MPSPLTHADRRALGIRARQQLARSGHASFSATACPHSPLDLLRQSERDRIPSLLGIKHARMAASPFGFFRGAVSVMAADLACHPNTGLTTQICGDAHAANLGAYAGPCAGIKQGGAKDGGLVFDINDFDETIHGPFEYDLKRLATSLLLAGREAGIKRSARRDAVLHFAEQYRRLMHEFAAMPVLELARYQIHRLAHIDPMPAILQQAERATPQKSLKNLTEPQSSNATPTLSSRAESTQSHRDPTPTLSSRPEQSQSHRAPTHTLSSRPESPPSHRAPPHTLSSRPESSQSHPAPIHTPSSRPESSQSHRAPTHTLSSRPESSQSHRDDAAERPAGLAATNPARIFRSDPPLLTRLAPAEATTVLGSLTLYTRTLQPERRHFLAQYTPQDVAFKVVGTGSVGLRDYCIYFEGSDLSAHPNSARSASLASHDPLFLQIKEEPASTYAPYLPDGDAHAHQGHRVVDGQRAMQLTSDPFLGYTTIPDDTGRPRDYLVRQLNDHKATLDLQALTAASLLGYADVCGELFARSHARAGDPVAMAAYLGNSARFDQALLTFARAYADKTEKDWATFKKSLKK